LHARGYSSELITRKLNNVKKFLNWLQKQGKINKTTLQKALNIINKEQVKYKVESPLEVQKTNVVPSIEQFKKVEYIGQKKAEGLAGEFYFRFHLQTYKIKS